MCFMLCRAARWTCEGITVAPRERRATKHLEGPATAVVGIYPCSTLIEGRIPPYVKPTQNTLGGVGTIGAYKSIYTLGDFVFR